MRKRNDNPLDKSYLKQPGPDFEINSYLIPIYRNYFIRTGEISSNKDYKLINEELNFNHHKVQFSIDTKIKSNSEVSLSSACIPNYIFNKNANITINDTQFSFDYFTSSVKVNFGNFKILILIFCSMDHFQSHYHQYHPRNLLLELLHYLFLL